MRLSANEYAERAMALDDTLSWAIGLSLHVACSQGREHEGVVIARRGFELNPSNADVRAFLGIALSHVGQFHEAVGHYRAAMSLNPFYPNWYRIGLSRNLMILDEFDEALILIEEILSTEPAHLHSWLQKAYMFGQIGRLDDAEEAIREINQLAPNLRLVHAPGLLSINDEAATQRFLDGLRKVGFPE